MEGEKQGGKTERLFPASISPIRSGRDHFLSKTSVISHLRSSQKCLLTQKFSFSPADSSLKSAETAAFTRLLNEKEATCARLSKQSEKLASELSKATTEVRNLKRLSATYEQKLKEFFAKDYEKKLTQCEAEIAVLREENSQLRSRQEAERSKFSEVLTQNEAKVTEIRSQFCAFVRRARDGESKSPSENLYAALQKLQQENRLLAETVESQAVQHVTKTQFDSLEAQFRGVEDMQDRVLAENCALKHEVSSLGLSEKALRSQLTLCQSWLLEAHFDLGQILLVVKSLRTGSPIDPSTLLRTSRPATDSEPGADCLSKFAAHLRNAKAKLGELRSVLAESYSEFCSQQTCGMQ